MKFNNVEELVEYYKKYENFSLGDIYSIIQNQYPHIELNTNKGIAGQILEAIIGNAPNSNSNPDVELINVELKVLPLRKISNKIQPKERSKIKSINYNNFGSLVWNNSELRKKIETILFLLYEHPTGKTFEDWNEFIFKGTMLYKLNKESEPVVEKDWEVIRDKIKNEIADELSEGDGKILGACTSGTGKSICYGRNKDKYAKQRSYSLKHSYLKVFYEKKINNVKYSSLKLKPNIEPEDYVLEKLNDKLNGKNLANIVKEYNVDYSNSSKSAFSVLINKILKLDSKNKILELEEKGISIKTIPVNPDYNPWEAMSFPKFSLVDIIHEEWDGIDKTMEKNKIDEFDSIYESESVFKNMISQGFIFIPIIKEKNAGKYKNWRTWQIGKSVYWKANEDELKTIKEEWEKAKAIVQNEVIVKKVKYGKGFRQENNLIKSSETEFIHIRPHARDSNDIDKPYFEYTEERVQISWQSFWLNKTITEKILKNK